MDFFGYRLEKINEVEELELEQALKTLKKHGFRAIKETKDKSKKISSMKKANEKRTSDTREKVLKSIQILQGKNEKINVANIVENCNVSRITAKKYLNLYLEENKVNLV